jgi:predicted dehydrogenase
VALEHFNIVDHGIHYIDLSRYFTGQTPRHVKATTTMVPGQSAVAALTQDCDLCGKVIPRRLWAAAIDGQQKTFCDAQREQLYRDYDYWLTEGMADHGLAAHGEQGARR